MSGLSRRRLLASLAGFSAALFLPACCFLRRLAGRGCEPPPSLQEWKAAAAAWWAARAAARERQRAAETAAGTRAGLPFPRPYLVCGKSSGSRGTIGEQVRAMSPGTGGAVVVTVANTGNAPSWACCVDLYEAPAGAEGRAFSAMKRTDTRIVAVLPGAVREVSLTWPGTGEAGGSLVARCYDPVLDPACAAWRAGDRKCEGSAWGGGGG